jgi:hypothetical protein
LRHSCSVQFFPFTFASLPVSMCQVHSPLSSHSSKNVDGQFPNGATEDYLTSAASGSDGSLSAHPARWLPRAARTLYLLNVFK